MVTAAAAPFTGGLSPGVAAHGGLAEAEALLEPTATGFATRLRSDFLSMAQGNGLPARIDDVGIVRVDDATNTLAGPVRPAGSGAR